MNKKIIQIIVLFLVLAPSLSFAFFNPGDTLDPGCTPTTPGCAISTSTYVGYSYASSTFPSFTYASSTYYLASNPAGYISSYSETDPIWMMASTSYLTIAAAGTTYLPLSASTSLAYIPLASSTSFAPVSSSTQWITNGSAIYYNLGNVGIGTTNPLAGLHASTSLVIIGGGEGGTPTAATIRGAAASGTDIVGADLTFDASNGTGLGGSGALIFRTATPSSNSPIVENIFSSSTQQVGTNTYNVNVGTNPNRLLIVNVTVQGTGPAISGMTYNGSPMGLISATQDTSNRLYMWSILNPSPGTNPLIITNTGGTAQVVVTAVGLSNVNQTTPTSTATSTPNGNLNASSVTMNLTNSATNELVVGVLMTGTVSPTPTTGQTVLASAVRSGVYGTMFTAAGSPSVSNNWNFGSSVPWSHIAVSVKPIVTPPSTTQNVLTERFRVTNSGKIGIGTTTPSATLTVLGSVRYVGFGSGALQSDSLGNITVSSDERLKDIQGTFSKGLAEIKKLTPINYKWKSETGYDIETTYSGFSAQNVQSVIPEAIGQNSEGYLTLSDRPIIAAIVNSIKEIGSFITKITNGIAYLKDIVIARLTIGSAANPAGVTMFSPSGNPFCVTVSDAGAVQSTTGDCGSVTVVPVFTSTVVDVPVVSPTDAGTSTSEIFVPTDTSTATSSTDISTTTTPIDTPIIIDIATTTEI